MGRGSQGLSPDFSFDARPSASSRFVILLLAALFVVLGVFSLTGEYQEFLVEGYGSRRRWIESIPEPVFAAVHFVLAVAIGWPAIVREFLCHTRVQSDGIFLGRQFGLVPWVKVQAVVKFDSGPRPYQHGGFLISHLGADRSPSQRHWVVSRLIGFKLVKDYARELILIFNWHSRKSWLNVEKAVMYGVEMHKPAIDFVTFETLSDAREWVSNHAPTHT